MTDSYENGSVDSSAGGGVADSAYADAGNAKRWSSA